MSLWIPSTLKEYDELTLYLNSVREKSRDDWAELYRWYGRNDLFFLLNFIASERFIIHSETKERFYYHQHYVDVCRKYRRQIELGGGLDCSGRGSGKSTVRTKWITIQQMIRNPDISIFIFSVEKQLAKKHLRQIKDELEKNKLLKALFDDVLWENPHDAVKAGDTVWSIEDGLRVKRRMIRSTQTVEMHAFFGGGPVGTRADIIMFDDIERRDIVGSPEKIKSLEEAYSQAVNLLTPVVIEKALVFVTNTRFTEAGLIEGIKRQYEEINPEKVCANPGEDMSVRGNGPLGGTPMYPFTRSILLQKFEETKDKADYGLQFALSYIHGEERRINIDNIMKYEEPFRDFMRGRNCYILVDPSRGVNDPCAILNCTLTSDKKKVITDGVYRKIDPSGPEMYNEIWLLIQRARNFGARVIEVRVERTGQSVWPQLIQKELRARGEYIQVRESVPPPTRTEHFESGKQERIFQRLAPSVNNGEWLFPKLIKHGGAGILTRDEKGKTFDLAELLLEGELGMFPRSRHDDGMDAMGLIEDKKLNDEYPLQWPPPVSWRMKVPTSSGNSKYTWMSS